MASNSDPYSSLEAVVQDPDKGKYVVSSHETPWKQVAPDSVDQWKQVAPNLRKQNDALEVAASPNTYSEVTRPEAFYGTLVAKEGFEESRARRFWTRSRIIIAAVVGALVVLAAILGGVLGSRAASRSSHAASSSTSPRTETNAQRNIAAVGWTANSANNSRVYFQDDTGQIMEASNAAGSSSWSINTTGTGAKNGSALAAAVSRPGQLMEITVIYVNSNDILHDTTYSGGSWKDGSLSNQNYRAMSNSSLSVMYNFCARCSNTTIIAYQDVNGFIQVANSTATGWSLTQLSGSKIDPVPGTGIALHPFYRSDAADQLNIYTQQQSLNISLSTWSADQTNNGNNGWIPANQIYETTTLGSPLAAAASYTNVSTGYESWIELLTMASDGIRVDTWSGVKNDWLVQGSSPPSVMANSTGNPKIYGSVAMTPVGDAYAVVKQDGQVDSIESWQVVADTTDWISTGNVNLNGAWG